PLAREEHRDRRRPGNGLLEELQPLTRQVLAEYDTRKVPAGPRQTGRQSQLYRMWPRDEHDNRNRLRRVTRGPDRRRATRNDDVHVALHEVGRKRRKAFITTVGRASFDLQISALHITQFTENLDEITTRVVCRGRRR